MRILILAMLAAGSVAAPASAQSTGYRATLAQAATGESRAIAGGTSWRCNGADCMAAASPSRPAIVCEAAAKKVGRLAAFTARGVAFDAAALAKCNAKAKGGATAS